MRHTNRLELEGDLRVLEIPSSLEKEREKRKPVSVGET